MPDLQEEFGSALTRAVSSLGWGEAPEVVVEPSAVAEVGDFSSPIAFRLAKALRRAPREIAQDLVGRLQASPPPHCLEVNVSGGGYINLRVDFSTYAPEVIADLMQLGRIGYVRGILGRLDEIAGATPAADIAPLRHAAAECRLGDFLALLAAAAPP